jgi:hypothetical protein
MRKQKVPELIEFIHSKRETRPDGTVKGTGPLIGCVIARRVRGRNSYTGQFEPRISLGWSKVNVSEGDTFDKKRALKIARGRAIVGNSPEMPYKISAAYDRMMERSARYFKFINWA